MVPHLITALNAPINELEQRILDSTPAIERWFRLEWMEHTPPLYSSVDVRNAGFKLAPVDTNLFPEGWNNLTPAMLPLAVQAGMAAIEKICPEARNLLVIPENQPQSTFYWENVLQLKRVFHQAGLNVRFGSLSADVEKAVTINLPTGESITLEPLIRTDKRLGLKDFDPCTILMNNALGAGVPGMLEDLNEQYLLPPLHASDTVRRKSRHFQAYEEISKRFGKLLDCLSSHIDALLTKVRRKYKEYGINEKPFIVVKADQGLVSESGSSMGIMTVRDVKDLDALMAKAKTASQNAGSQTLPEVIIQEGVMTNERVNAAVAEPVVYMMDRYVVGGFYRIHAQRVPDESISVSGSSYVPLAFAESGKLPQPGEKPGSSSPNRFYMYGVIARLAMLAASYELEATDPNAEVYD